MSPFQLLLSFQSFQIIKAVDAMFSTFLDDLVRNKNLEDRYYYSYSN